MRTTQLLKRIKTGILALGLAGMVGGFFAPSVAHAHDAYFLSITLDPDNRQFIGIVSEDKNENDMSVHAEIANTGTYFGEYADDDTTKTYFTNGGEGNRNFTLPAIKPKSTMEQIGETYSKLMRDENALLIMDTVDYKDPLLFSFPGRHVASTHNVAQEVTLQKGNKRDGDNSDRQQAQFLNTNLVGGLNQGIRFIYDIAYANDRTLQREKTLEIATTLANNGARVAGRAGAKEGKYHTFAVNGQTFEVADGRSLGGSPGIAASNYIILTHKVKGETRNDFIKVPWSVSKGYGKNQRMWTTVKGSGYEDVYKDDVSFLSWKHVVLQGAYNSAVAGIEFAGVDKLNPPNIVERTIAEVFTSIQNTMESMLGLHSIPELMLNRGTYAMSSFKGVMPKRMADVADYVHLFTQFVAWLLLAGAFAKILTMRNLSALNPKMRVDLKEGAMDLIGAGFALLMFIPIFRSMLFLNAGLVQFFGGMSDQVDLFGTANMTNGGYIGPILVGMVFFILSLYMNITYILRGITIAALYALAPFFIVSIAYGGKFKQLFSTFLKELVGMIFIQTIHAALLGMYSLAFFNGASTGILYTMVLTASFIPITKFIKKDLLGMKENFGGMLAGGAVSTGAGLAFAGASAARMGGKMKADSAGGGGGTNFTQRTASGNGGGGGGGGSQDFNTLLDNDTATGGTPNFYSGGTPAYTAQKAEGTSSLYDKIKEGGKSVSAKGAAMRDDVYAKTFEGAKALPGKAVPQSWKDAASNLHEKTGPLGVKDLAKDIGKGLSAAAPMAGKVMKTGAKAAILGAATIADTSMEGQGFSRAASQAMLHGGLHGKMSGGGGGGSSRGNGATNVPMPSHDLLDGYEAQAGRSGFVVSATKDNGDLVNIHDTEQLMKDSELESLRDTDEQVIGITSKQHNDPELNDFHRQVFNDFESEDPDAMAKWNSVGVDFARKTPEGNIAIGYNKKRMGINSVESDDKYTKVDIKPYSAQEFFNPRDFAENMPKKPQDLSNFG